MHFMKGPIMIRIFVIVLLILIAMRLLIGLIKLPVGMVVIVVDKILTKTFNLGNGNGYHDSGERLNEKDIINVDINDSGTSIDVMLSDAWDRLGRREQERTREMLPVEVSSGYNSFLRRNRIHLAQRYRVNIITQNGNLITSRFFEPPDEESC